MLVLHLAIRISQKGIEPSDTIYSEDRQNARRRENVGGRPSLARTTSSCASQVTPIIPRATPKNARHDTVHLGDFDLPTESSWLEMAV